MKTCPVCHRSVPEGAAKCPHHDCGAALGASHPHVKRPPPPVRHVQVSGSDAHPHTDHPVAGHAVGAPKSGRRLATWLAVLFACCALLAAIVLLRLSASDREKQVASDKPAPLPVQQTPEPTEATAATAVQQSNNEKPASAPSDAAGTSPPKAADKPSPAGESPATKTPAEAPSSPNRPKEKLGLADEPPKEPSGHSRPKMPDEPTGLVADAPPKPEALGVPMEPTMGVVADTPLELYAERTKPKTPEWLAQRGGTMESQSAVETGLNWLARHQGTDGHWGSDCLGSGPDARCNHDAPCQGPGEAYEMAHTGLALLAFQAAGHYYFNAQKYSDNVTKGLNYMLEEQARDGSLVGSQNPTQEQVAAGAHFQQYFMYEHAMATFALCEACAVALAEGKVPDPRYRNAAERAVLFIENVQHLDGGWRYTPGDNSPSDCSVSGWAMLALKTAREAKFAVSPATISRMMAFFALHHDGDHTFYFTPAQRGTDAMTGVGMMAVEFFQHKLDSPIVTGGAAYLADKADHRHERGALAGCDYYMWYNCTMAMFQVGGDPWQRWNDAVRDHVISLQVQGDGCDRGSWPPADQWSSRGGRIYSTALAVLTLEVYYRFQRVAGQTEKEKFFGK